MTESVLKPRLIVVAGPNGAGKTFMVEAHALHFQRRPDMALFLFARAILEGKPIDVFNHGKMKRDFTYIDDIVEGIIRVLDNTAVITVNKMINKSLAFAMAHKS